MSEASALQASVAYALSSQISLGGLAALLLARRALLHAFHRAEHLARVDAEDQRADQRDDDRAAAELAAAAAGKAAAAAAADVDAAGIERIEPHCASLPLCACEKALDRGGQPRLGF